MELLSIMKDQVKKKRESPTKKTGHMLSNISQSGRQCYDVTWWGANKGSHDPFPIFFSFSYSY